MAVPSSAPVAAHAGEGSALQRALGSLANRDFRLLWSFHVLNFLGLSMELLALGWIVLVVTDSPFWVGAINGASGVAQVGFGLFGGAIADRFDRRAVVAVGVLARAFIVLSLAVVALSGPVEIWQLLAWSIVRGLATAVVMPAGEALIYDTVGPTGLLNAISLKMGAFSVARIPASLLAGGMLSAYGTGWAILVIAAVIALSPLPMLFIRPQFRQPAIEGTVFGNLAHGVRYAGRSAPIRSLLIFSVIVEMFGFSYHVMLPVVAREVLQVGAAELGILGAVGAAGGILATLLLASLGDITNKTKVMVVASMVAAAMLATLGFSPWLILTAGLAMILAGTLLVYDSMIATLLQLLTSDEMRGRVLGLYGLTWGFNPVGGFVIGTLASLASVPIALAAGGGLILLGVAGIIVPTRSLWANGGPGKPGS